MRAQQDAVGAALERAADIAEAAAHDQQQAADIARDAARDRVEGTAVDDAQTTHAARTVLQLLGRSAELLAATVGSLRRVWAQALADENLSIRQIGERLGVSHQRVSALLARHRRARSDRHD